MIKTAVNTKDRLVEHGIRPSVQRMAIMHYLLENRTHPTPEQVYTALAEQIPTLSRTTVYNTLTLLAEHGAILHLSIDPRGSRYDGDTSVHGHFMCTECGELHDIFFETPPTLPELADHRADQTLIYYKGVCRDCLCRNKKNN